MAAAAAASARAASSRRAFGVWWKDLERWVIPSSLILRGTLPAGWTRVRLRSLLTQVATRVKADAEIE